jgi:putative secretion ATPase (PEP-CTERM system associated)
MYADFYRLRGLPFELTPDSRLFYPSPIHRGALAYLTYGLRKAEGFVLITGDVGTGKTLLVDYLLSIIDRGRYLTSKVLTTQLGPDDMVRMVASGFGLDPEGKPKATLIRELERFLIDARRRRIRPLIIVDEVHNLPRPSLEELRMLANYRFEETPVVQTFLLGQTQFRKALANGALEQVKQRVVASSHLRPLSEGETRSYIEHRLRAVGWRNDPSIPEVVFSLVHDETCGIPRRINVVLDRLLLLGYVEERHDLGTDLFDTVMRELRIEGLFAPPVEGAVRHDPR